MPQQTPETMKAAVRAATARLAEAGVASPDVDAVVLAAHAGGTSVSDVRAAMILGGPAPEGLEALVGQRAQRVPLQHLTGRAPFRHLELEVGPGVFVPRPETEDVAGFAIDAARAARESSGREPVVVDLCTGSGAIALAIADELPGAVVHAVELSPLAHAWAERNVAATGLPVTLEIGDATTSFGDLEGLVDVVVSNPPYIPTDQVPVDPEVRDHDPEIALYGGSVDGLAIPVAVAARAAELLRPGGVLVMEHADVQGVSLPAALRRSGSWRDVEDRTDATGRPRACVAVRV
ncbi:peptide chain release factor N(5)-glutamine methyltransferase [Janibacter sp. G1551]|uniref:peptide chain release factor N(5)-glutamine methyltransferase n=1 Tax=Janibacter sp. G1551 TaxID=3420440 RepID=UPI003D05354B